jgi:hypothetical protein
MFFMNKAITGERLLRLRHKNFHRQWRAFVAVRHLNCDLPVVFEIVVSGGDEEFHRNPIVDLTQKLYHRMTPKAPRVTEKRNEIT